MFGIELELARATGKGNFYFSPFSFRRMRECGNTHYCFHCGGDVGFTPGPNGEVTNSSVGKGKKAYNPMKHHDPVAHAKGVVGGADQFLSARDWLGYTKFAADFPFVIKIQ